MSNRRDHTKLNFDKTAKRELIKEFCQTVSKGGFMALLGDWEQKLSKLVGGSAPKINSEGNQLQIVKAHLLQHENARDYEAFLDVILNGDHVDVLCHLEQEIASEQGHLHDKDSTQSPDAERMTPDNDAQQTNVEPSQTTATGANLQPEEDDNNLVQNPAAPPVEDTDGTSTEYTTAPPQPSEQDVVASVGDAYLDKAETGVDACSGFEGGHCDVAGDSCDSMGDVGAG